MFLAPMTSAPRTFGQLCVAAEDAAGVMPATISATRTETSPKVLTPATLPH